MPRERIAKLHTFPPTEVCSLEIQIGAGGLGCHCCAGGTDTATSMPDTIFSASFGIASQPSQSSGVTALLPLPDIRQRGRALAVV